MISNFLLPHRCLTCIADARATITRMQYALVRPFSVHNMARKLIEFDRITQFMRFDDSMSGTADVSCRRENLHGARLGVASIMTMAAPIAVFFASLWSFHRNKMQHFTGHFSFGAQCKQRMRVIVANVTKVLCLPYTFGRSLAAFYAFSPTAHRRFNKTKGKFAQNKRSK